MISPFTYVSENQSRFGFQVSTVSRNQLAISRRICRRAIDASLTRHLVHDNRLWSGEIDVACDAPGIRIAEHDTRGTVTNSRPHIPFSGTVGSLYVTPASRLARLHKRLFTRGPAIPHRSTMRFSTGATKHASRRRERSTNCDARRSGSPRARDRSILPVYS